jgi:hypothetical protein
MIDNFGSTWKNKTKGSPTEKQMADDVNDVVMVDITLLLSLAVMSSPLWEVRVCTISSLLHIASYVHAVRLAEQRWIFVYIFPELLSMFK